MLILFESSLWLQQCTSLGNENGQHSSSKHSEHFECKCTKQNIKFTRTSSSGRLIANPEWTYFVDFSEIIVKIHGCCLHSGCFSNRCCSSERLISSGENCSVRDTIFRPVALLGDEYKPFREIFEYSACNPSAALVVRSSRRHLKCLATASVCKMLNVQV